MNEPTPRTTIAFGLVGPRRRALLLAAIPSLWVLPVACASGPRPAPGGLSPAERLAFAEDVLRSSAVRGTFELDSHGAHESHFTGTLELTGSNALLLVAEGRRDGADVKLTLDSMSGEPNRSVSRGPSVSGHRGGATAQLNDAVAIGLVRLGLLHDVALLSDDEMIAQAEGGVREYVVARDVKDAGPDQVDDEPCHRLDFIVAVEGKPKGEATVCFSDATSLVLQRRQTVHADSQDMTVTERFKWISKR